MRGFAGYNFKTDKLAGFSRDTLDLRAKYFDDDEFDEYVGQDPEWNYDQAQLNTYYLRALVSAKQQVIDSKLYLMRPHSANLSIFGIGQRDSVETDGIIWGASEKNLIEALYYAKIDDFFPYNIPEDTIFYVKDGELYLTHMAKGKKTETPLGAGTIYSIDDIDNICVELDDDGSLFYDFSANELTMIED